MQEYIEHTLLKQDATENDLVKLFDEAIKYNFYGVCINPCYVSFAKKYLENKNIKIVTVIGFPLGANTTNTKVFEAQEAVKNGADEIDMVINVTWLKDKKYDLIIDEIKQIKTAINSHKLKVILETDLLTSDEIKTACELCIKGGADLVKTSTGFVKNGVGAKVEDVKLMYKTVYEFGLEVKASGGIRDRKTAQDMIEAGASRLGTSSGVKIVENIV